MGWFYTEGRIFDSWQKHRRDEVAEESRVCQDASILLQLEGPTKPRISKKTQKPKNTKSIEIQKYSSSLRDPPWQAPATSLQLVKAALYTAPPPLALHTLDLGAD